MSLSSNLVTRVCPNCNREILASSVKCQFCGVDLVPTAPGYQPVEVPRPLYPTRKGPRWHEAAASIIGILWMTIGAATTLLGLVAGLAIFAIAGGTIVFFLGLGIFRHDSSTLMVSKFASLILAVSGFYRLIAAAATQGTPAASSFPIGALLLMVVIGGFQAYVFHSVDE